MVNNMNKYEITKKIENIAPPETAEAWDCVGFMVETSNQEVSKIMLCLTPTEDIILQARIQNCDMIISHHPLFYVPCAWKDIDIYSAHTNLDKAQGGTTDTLIKSLELEKFTQPADHEFLRYVLLDNPVSIEDFAKFLRKISPNLRYVNNQNKTTIQKIAFCAGSGSEFISEAKFNGADALVTGDLKFHTALDSNIVVFDIGHFDSEILVLPELKKLIGNDVEIVFANETSPFIY